MKIALLDIQTRKTAINKTMAGGYGTASSFSCGNNILIKLLEAYKKGSIRIPLIEFAYIAAIFKNRGDEVVSVYGNDIPDADAYIIYGSLVEHNSEIKVAKEIKQHSPSSVVGFIGLMPTVLPELFLDSGDFVVKGPPEIFFENYSGQIKSLSGVVECENPLNNIDKLPFPSWDTFDMKRFIHKPFFWRYPVYPVLTSRGCSFSCRYYCAYPLIAGEKTVFRSVQNIIDELKYLKKKYKTKAILFRDANFGINRDSAVSLCKRMISEKLNIFWACETHPGCLDEEIVDLFYKSGNRAITIGVETFDEEIIEKTKRKNSKQEHLNKIIMLCEKKGIKVMAHYILGNIHDTTSTVEENIEFAKKMDTSFAQFNISTPYPGTEYCNALKDRINTTDWERFDTFTLVFDHPHISSKQMQHLKEKAFIDFYFRPGWFFKKYIRNSINDLFDRRNRFSR